MLASSFKIERIDFMKKKTNGTELLLIIPAVSLLAMWILYMIFEK